MSRILKLLHSVSMVEVRRKKQFHFYRLGPGVQVRLDDQFVHFNTSAGDGSQVELAVPRASVDRNCPEILSDIFHSARSS
jgi:hypothetical protein